MRNAALATFALAAAASPVAAGVFADYDPARHNRFVGGSAQAAGNVENPTFLLGEYDLTGVGVGNVGGVLISDRHVLAATHFPGSHAFVGADGNRRSFGAARRNSLTTTFTENGQSVTRASDIQIVLLDDDANPDTPFAGLDLDLYSPVPILEATPDQIDGGVLFAYDQDDRAGRNLITGGRIVEGEQSQDVPGSLLIADGDGNLPTVVTAYDFDTNSNGGDRPVGNGDEIGLVGGDSGHASLFVTPDGTLSLLGSHYGVSEIVDPSTPTEDVPNYISFSSFAGIDLYLPQIRQIIQDDGASASFSTVLVPEPAAATLLLLPAAALLRRRGRA